MSYYYNYFLGAFDTKTEKFEIAGPFDKYGNTINLLSKTSLFASGLHEEMDELAEEQMEDEMKEQLSYINFQGEKVIDKVKYLMFSDMPCGSVVREAFVLKKDVFRYRENENEYLSFEDFAESILTPKQYSALATDPTCGITIEEYDMDEGTVQKIRYAKDYMFFTWINKNSMEYESWIIQQMAYNMDYDYEYRLGKNKKLVLLETEG